MDDLSNKISDFLSDPAAMEKIKSMASMFSNSQESTAAPEPKKASQSTDSGMNFDPSMLAKMTGLLGTMHQGDPRVDLLLALKPNLSEPRRKKVDDAINLLRIVKIMPILREQGIL